MNIKFITGAKVDGLHGKVTGTYTSTLALCGQGKPEGSAIGLVPVKLRDGIVVTPTVTVTSATNTTKRGVRSAVIKVSIPYSAITPDGNGNFVPDPSRSGAEMSMHLVVALPSTATKDVQGVNGDAAKASAEAQVALVYALLRALIGIQFGAQPNMVVNWLDDTDENIDVMVTDAGYVSNPKAGDSLEQAGLSDPGEPFVKDHSAVIASDNVGNLEGAGFDLSHFQLIRTLNGLLSRIANGLPPLTCGDVGNEPIPATLVTATL